MPNDQPYQVSWSSGAIDAVKQLARKAKPLGLNQILAQLIRTIDQRLRSDPLNFGEVYRSRGPIAEHLGVHVFVAVNFAVDRQRKIVLVRDCRVLSGHGL